MSDWIDKEGEEHQKQLDEQKRINELIAYSNYWAKLREQIVKDVEYINKQSVWKENFTKMPITVENIDEGYKISNVVFPAAYIRVLNRGNKIELAIEIKRDMHSSARTHKESFDVVTDGSEIYLRNGDQLFMIPIQASQHILSPIIKGLKGEL